MNFFHHKDLGNHLLQLYPKVVKHPVYLPQDLFVSFYHPWCRSLWLSDCPKGIYRPNGCRSCVTNGYFVVLLADDCHFTPQVVWLPAHSAGCNAQQWTWNSCSHYDWYSTLAIFVSFIVPRKELLRILDFRTLLRTGCSRLSNQHEQYQEMYWVFSCVHRWLAMWINLYVFSGFHRAFLKSFTFYWPTNALNCIKFKG